MKREYLAIKENNKPFKIWDLVIVGVAILFVVALLCVIFIPTASAQTVYIYREGKLVKKINLADCDPSYVFELSDMKILIETDGVKVYESDCDDSCCVKIGKISQKGECIVCVPKMITVELK